MSEARGLFQQIFDKIEMSKSEIVEPTAQLTPAGRLRGERMIEEMRRQAEMIRLLKADEGG
jgi:hypothetical protein